MLKIMLQNGYSSRVYEINDRELAGKVETAITLLIDVLRQAYKKEG